VQSVSSVRRSAFALLLCLSVLSANGAYAGRFQPRPPSKIKRLVVWVLNLFEIPKP